MIGLRLFSSFLQASDAIVILMSYNSPKLRTQWTCKIGKFLGVEKMFFFFFISSTYHSFIFFACSELSFEVK